MVVRDASGVRVQGPLAPYADAFAEQLAVSGYTAGPVARHLRLMAQVSRWLLAGGLGADGLTPALAEDFLRSRRDAVPSPADREGAAAAAGSPAAMRRGSPARGNLAIWGPGGDPGPLPGIPGHGAGGAGGDHPERGLRDRPVPGQPSRQRLAGAAAAHRRG